MCLKKINLSLICMLAVSAACGSGNDEMPEQTEVEPVAEPALADNSMDLALAEVTDVDMETVAAEAVADESEVEESPNPYDHIPEEFRNFWNPWKGDLDGIVERRVLRVLVPFGGYQYYYVRGRPRGAIVELLQKMEEFLNKELQRRHIRVFVVPMPVSRDHLIPALLEGNADLVAGDLTITDERRAMVHFSRPLLKNINEVLVTGPAAPEINSVDDLAGHEIVVRESSSYHEHLLTLAERMTADGLEPPHIELADELLEAEDLLEMVDAGMIPMTFLDDYKADFWAEVFENLTVRDDISINSNGSIAWAMKKDAPELAEFVERFLRKYGRGTLVGNDTFNRYLANANRVRCSMAFDQLNNASELARWFQLYGEEYGFDWLMLAAQGYQESRLNQARKSAAGALGVMQIKPTTAADPKVNIPDITVLENNIHAGAKYMRFLADRYFSDMDERNQWFFSLAAYNAGPARVAKLRREAAGEGLDPNRWVHNVEIIAARRIGRETVTYVSNIYKYYMGYKISEERLREQRRRYEGELTQCTA